MGLREVERVEGDFIAISPRRTIVAIRQLVQQLPEGVEVLGKVGGLAVPTRALVGDVAVEAAGLLGHLLQPGHLVNVEYDVLGKYVQGMLAGR